MASAALGETLTASGLVDLENSDRLGERRTQEYQTLLDNPASGYRRFFSPENSGLVYSLTDQLGDALGEEPVFWLTRMSEIVGAVRVPAKVLLRHTASIIRIDGDSVHALSEDGNEGLMIDSNRDDTIEAFEVAVWGKRWPHLI